MNRSIATVIIAPLTTPSHDYPTRVPVSFQGKHGWIVLNQIRTVDKRRLAMQLGKLKHGAIQKVKAVIQEMRVE